MPTTESWRAEVESRGFERAEVHSRDFALAFDSGSALLRDPATLTAAVPEWQWCALAAGDSGPVLYRVQDMINTYFYRRTFEVTVVAGCVSAWRAGR
jgi:hypothetical protein